MKAKEYADLIVVPIESSRSLSSDEQIEIALMAIRDVSIGFLDEIGELIKSRKAMSNSAVAAVVREQNMKWRAMCRHVAKGLGDELLEPDGFKTLVKGAFPEIHDYMERKKAWKS